MKIMKWTPENAGQASVRTYAAWLEKSFQVAFGGNGEASRKIGVPSEEDSRTMKEISQLCSAWVSANAGNVCKICGCCRENRFH